MGTCIPFELSVPRFEIESPIRSGVATLHIKQLVAFAKAPDQSSLIAARSKMFLIVDGFHLFRNFNF